MISTISMINLVSMISMISMNSAISTLSRMNFWETGQRRCLEKPWISQWVSHGDHIYRCYVAYLKSDKKAQNWRKCHTSCLKAVNKDSQCFFWASLLWLFTLAQSLGVSGGKGQIKGEIRQLMESSLKWSFCYRDHSDSSDFKQILRVSNQFVTWSYKEKSCGSGFLCLD